MTARSRVRTPHQPAFSLCRSRGCRQKLEQLRARYCHVAEIKIIFSSVQILGFQVSKHKQRVSMSNMDADVGARRWCRPANDQCNGSSFNNAMNKQ